MESEQHNESATTRREKINGASIAIGITAAGGAIGWAGAKAYEFITESNLDTFEEIAASMGSATISAVGGLAISIEYAIRKQENNFIGDTTQQD